jgi:hypothetical protein
MYDGPDAAGLVTLHFGGYALASGSREHVNFKVQVFVSLLIFVITLINEYSTAGLPLARLRTFRTNFLNERHLGPWTRTLGTSGFRMNVMFIRYWFVFTWAWSCNFDATHNHHRDAGLLLTRFQGVCGKAYRAQKAEIVSFDGSATAWTLFRTYRLFPWQQQKTRHVKAILSVPIFRQSESPSRPAKCVGILNIDAVTDEAAKLLRDNEVSLAEYFTVECLPLGHLSL